MAERFFNIRLGPVPALVDVQNFLRRSLPDDTQFVDPDQFHITLVFIEEDSDIDLAAENPSPNLPAFGIGGFGISAFDTNTRPGARRPDDGGRFAVHVMIDRSPPLEFLQSSIFYLAQAAGVRISRHSFPGRWRPHITLAWTQADPEYIGLPSQLHLEVGGFEVSGDDFTTIQQWALRSDVPVQEFMDGEGLIADGSNLAKMLNRAIDKDKRERPAIVKALAQSASIERSTMSRILSSEITCPGIDRLRGFSKALGVSQDTVIGWAGTDGCEDTDAQQQAGDEQPMQVSVTELESSDEAGRIRVHLVSESFLRGTYPQIDLPPDINRADITKELGDDARFITLPIGRFNAKSRNKRKYLPPAMTKLAQEVNTKRPEGGWGHIKAENIGTEYAPPAVRWLAATVDATGTVWGKGLPLTKEAQQYFKVARATRAKVGTSLYAFADVDGDGNVSDLDLIKLDLADPARVGVPMTAAQPHLSAEMEGGGQDRQGLETADLPTGRTTEGEQSGEQVTDNNDEEDSAMADNVTELTVANDRLKTQIAEHETIIKGLRDFEGDINSIRELFSIGSDDDVVKFLQQQNEQLQELVDENVHLLSDSLDSRLEEKVKMEALRPMVRQLVLAEKPTTRKQLERTIDTVLDQDAMKTALQAKLASEMGPPQGKGTNNDRHSGSWESFLATRPSNQEA